MTATFSPPLAIGNAIPPRRPDRRAASARWKSSCPSTSSMKVGLPVCHTWPGSQVLLRTTRSWVAASNAGTSRPGLVQEPTERSVPGSRASKRCPTSQPSGSAMAARSRGAEVSSDSASASTRATRYWTAMRAASRSRLARRRAMVTARAPIRATVMTPVQWSAMPNASLVAPSGTDTTNAKTATIAVCLVDAPIAAITGPMSSSSTSTARPPRTASSAATRQTAAMASRNTPRSPTIPPVWVREPNRV